jgi:flagellar biosynthesis regulator FlaF
MTDAELKSKIIDDLRKLAQQATKTGKSSKNKEGGEELIQIGIMLLTISESILKNNYHDFMRTKEIAKIMAS